jgi:hypothetical protein
MERPNLKEIELENVGLFKPGLITITMSQGQWDGLLSAAYDSGHTLLELDDNEIPVAAYRK